MLNGQRSTWFLSALTAVATLPMFLTGAFAPEVWRWMPVGVGRGLSILAVVAVFCGLFRQLDEIKQRDNRWLVFLALVLMSLLTNDLHLTNVDYGHYFSPAIDNRSWQRWVHVSILARDPNVLPHSYRFLPYTIVRIFECLTDSLSYAVAIYRLIFQTALFFAIFKFARLFVSVSSSLVVALLYAAIYSVTIRYYAGQYTDPLSHLTFIVAFIALYKRHWALLTLVIVAGSLAKESILAIIPVVWWVSRHEKGAFQRVAVLTLLSGLISVGVRLWVTHGNVAYKNISGVGEEHIWGNLADINGQRQLACAVFIFAPFVLIGWRRLPSYLKILIVYFFPVLFLSNALFSWMREIRNFVPLIVPMAVATCFNLDQLSRSDPK
jgi:hypothetical protein